jgi:hypothetical protein
LQLLAYPSVDTVGSQVASLPKDQRAFAKNAIGCGKHCGTVIM